LVCAVFLIVVVLLQDNKSGLSSTVGGGADTFYGKNKSAAKDQMLSKITMWVAIVFVAVVLVVYIIQPDTAIDTDKWFKENFDSNPETTAAQTPAAPNAVDAAITEAVTEAETAADAAAEPQG
jgi:preprotein translocase subunit SecG